MSNDTTQTEDDAQIEPERLEPERYFLFAGRVYYPSGGMNDYRGCFQSIIDAQDAFKRGEYPDEFQLDYDWGHIARSTTTGLQQILYFDPSGEWKEPKRK